MSVDLPTPVPPTSPTLRRSSRLRSRSRIAVHARSDSSRSAGPMKTRGLERNSPSRPHTASGTASRSSGAIGPASLPEGRREIAAAPPELPDGRAEALEVLLPGSALREEPRDAAAELLEDLDEEAVVLGLRHPLELGHLLA